MTKERNGARAVARLDAGEIEASVEVDASPERVFRALASEEITAWWGRPGVFDTRQWHGDVVSGGRWSASGVARGEPYEHGGEYLEVEAPRKLAHTWEGAGGPGARSTVVYTLDPVDGGTRLALEHTGFTVPEVCDAFAMGWETSLARLAELLGAEHGESVGDGG